MAQPVGDLVFTLHTHLPFVLNHGRWPFGSDWLCEATVQCYLPVLRTLQRLAAEEVSPTVTINLSPILCEQMANPGFRDEVTSFIQQRLESCAENRRYFADTGQHDRAALCDYWQQVYEEARADFDALGGDVLAAFRRLWDREAIELITCAATHGYLPLLGRDESLDLQVGLAAAAHRRHFGRPPRGIWLPECAYRPRYEWTPPVGPKSGKARYRRRGVEEFLAAHGLEYFFTDFHLVRGGRALSAYRDYFPSLRQVSGPDAHPVYRREQRTPYTCYLVASRGGTGHATVYVRDPETTLQVWSRDVGYPGNEWYLDFHKTHFPGGLRFWRVTHPKSDLADKQTYVPERGREQARLHAAHYIRTVRGMLERAREDAPAPVLCSPFDTELFGHWWYEGVQWLGEVFAGLGAAGVAAATASEYLDRHPPADSITLLEGSWGEGGDHRVWLNRDTEWTWEMIYELEGQFWDLVAAGRWTRTPLLRRIVEQMARELLLFEASDWQFLITTWSARSYAETRFAEHCRDFTRLADLAARVDGGAAPSWEDEEFLRGKEAQDFCFPALAPHLEAAVRQCRPE
jgi:1,4-alpha-glucan branching enzyme